MCLAVPVVIKSIRGDEAEAVGARHAVPGVFIFNFLFNF